MANDAPEEMQDAINKALTRLDNAMGRSTPDDWIPDPRPIQRELEHPREHAYFTPVVEWPTLDEKLANPTMLLRLAKHVC